MITELEFKSLAAQGYNRIPADRRSLRRSRNAALALPEARPRRRRSGTNTFLLESVVGGERFGRYSFIGLPARTLLRATGKRTEVVTDGGVVETARRQPARLHRRLPGALQGRAAARACRASAAAWPATSATTRCATSRSAWPTTGARPAAIGTPDILLLQSEELAVIDNLSGRLYLIVYADPASPRRCAKARRRLRGADRCCARASPRRRSQRAPRSRSSATSRKADYLAAVLRPRNTSPPAT